MSVSQTDNAVVAGGGGKLALAYLNIVPEGPLKDTTAKAIEDFEPTHPNVMATNQIPKSE